VACPFGSTSTSYVYFVDAPEPTLIDAGVAVSPDSVIGPALARVGIRLSDIRWILLTHGHWDHLGGARALLDAARGAAEVAIHDADAHLLRRTDRHLETYWGERFRFVDDPEGLRNAKAVLLKNVAGEIGVHRSLANGDRLRLGAETTLTATHTPGHTAGSVSFVLDSGGTFTGDAVQMCGSSGSSRFPLFADPIAYRKSLQVLLEDVRPGELFLGHRFLGPDGLPVAASLKGPNVTSALKTSLAMESRIASVVGGLKFSSHRRRPEDFAPAAAAFGLSPENPRAWPAAFLITLAGYAQGDAS
jgi:hydroxyacylglutathione hydrolase